MTDDELRAHNLAVSYTQLNLLFEHEDPDFFSELSEDDFYSSYKSAYNEFLQLISLDS